MSDVNPDVKPILEMFAQQLRHPNVGAVLKDWRNTLSKGMLHFGRKEALDKGIEFNTLIYTELNPTPSRSGRRLTLEPQARTCRRGEQQGYCAQTIPLHEERDDHPARERALGLRPQ